MFDANPNTYDALKELWGLRARCDRPILVWAGAGVSSWVGYERWADLADRFHRTFLRTTSTYPREEGLRALEAQELPELFQICQVVEPQLYRSLIVESFRPKLLTPVYERFLTALDSLDRVPIVTTNVDETLERNLPSHELIQRSDIGRLIAASNAKTPFIAKVHGSVSDVGSTVFTSDDYRRVLADETFVATIQSLLTHYSIVFIGYGLRDRYLFDALIRNSQMFDKFGDGPHFLVTADERMDLPRPVKSIKYRTDDHKDHRSSILALELVASPRAESRQLHQSAGSFRDLQSGHFLSDFYPGGTWTSSNQLVLQRLEHENREAEMFVGPAWTNGELPTSSTAAYDLAVGLMCFDRVFLPVDTLGRAHLLLGEVIFWQLVKEDVLHFIQWEGVDGVLCLDRASAFGHLATGKLAPRSLQDIIRRYLQPAPNKVNEAEEMFRALEERTTAVDLSGQLNFADVCNGLLVSPRTRALLGISDGTPVFQVPRWVASSVLRLIQIARVGATCQTLDLASMKLMPGCVPVAATAFSAIAGGALSHEVVSFVLSGEVGVIPENILNAPAHWISILRFRDTQEGVGLRAEIRKLLQANDGAEIAATLEASLRATLPIGVLSSARSKMSALLQESNSNVSSARAIWAEDFHLLDGPTIWRQRSRNRFEQYLRDAGIGPYDLCPCGSFEKVKFCCAEALR